MTICRFMLGDVLLKSAGLTTSIPSTGDFIWLKYGHEEELFRVMTRTWSHDLKGCEIQLEDVCTKKRADLLEGVR